ncbi:glycerophosphodiester phosphodiesterase family protein [Desulfobacterales bacterium HSG16]|nr:glycerophosphodiester phosphodiesterase family protein [Desulfobacterales bacterium HSG16]
MITDITPPLIVAHRGFSAKYPENTMAAFQAAVDAGADMVELDVSFTKDREMVVIHDDILDRTTDGKGPVCEYTLEQLKKLDAGSWFHEKFSGQHILALSEVLDQIAPQILVNIEIKSSAFEEHYPKDSIENLIIELVDEKKLQDRVIISSFETRFLSRIAHIEKRPAISMLSLDPATEQTVSICRDWKVFSFNPIINKLTQNQVTMMQDAEIRVIPFTIEAEKDWQKALSLGVDGGFFNDLYLPRN